MYVNLPADMLALDLIELNTDFSNKQSCRENIEKYLTKIINPSLKAVMLNVCYRRSLIKSNFLDSVGYDVMRNEKGEIIFNDKGKSLLKKCTETFEENNKYFSTFIKVYRKLIEKDIDVFSFAVDFLKSKGIKVYFSLRMNDMHYLTNGAINSYFSLNYPKFMLKGLNIYNYACEQVHELLNAYVDELVTNYKVDGVELDFLRGAPFFEKEIKNPSLYMDKFLKRIKNTLLSKNNLLDLAIRVLSSEEANLKNGIDVASFISKGYVDIVTIENYYLPYGYELPIKEYKAAIDKENKGCNPYMFLCGCDYATGCSDEVLFSPTPELIRGFQDAVITAGADDVYLFNLLLDDDRTSILNEKTKKLEKGVVKNLQALNSNGNCRYLHVNGSEYYGYGEKRYPKILKAKESYKFKMTFSNKNTQGNFFIGLIKEGKISIRQNNDEKVGFFLQQKISYDWEEVIQEGKLWAKHISQVAPFVYKSSDITLNDSKEFTIVNEGETPITITWIELFTKGEKREG